MTKEEKGQFQIVACKVRMGVLTATHGAKAGHLGSSLSSADVFTYLYSKELNIDPKQPRMEDRDRFVRSKGHAAPGLYAALANRSFFSVEDLPTLRHIDSYLQGHPNMDTVPGVDMSAGSLGQGISCAAGMVLGLKHQNKSPCVYTFLGNGEMQEGQVREALMLSAHYKLDNFAFEIGKGEVMQDNTDVALIVNGLLVAEALDAAGILAGQGVSVCVINMASIKPPDEALVLIAFRECEKIVTCEKHSIIGGLGETVCAVVAEYGIACPMKRMGVNDEFGHSGPAGALLKQFDLCDYIVETAQKMCPSL